MRWSAAAWPILAAGLWASEAPAVAVGLDVATDRVDGEVTFTIGLTESTPITGYELFLGWDPDELSFSASTPIWAGGFTLAPTPESWQSSRVAQLSLALLDATSLFSVTFASSPLAAFDGEPDFYVTAAGRGGIAGAAGMGLLDLFPAGVGFDLGPSGFASAVVPAPPPPQPPRAVPEPTPPRLPLVRDELPALGAEYYGIVETIGIIESTASGGTQQMLPVRPPSVLGDAGDRFGVRDRVGYGRPDFVWSTTTLSSSSAVPEPPLPLLALAAPLALGAWKRLARLAK